MHGIRFKLDWPKNKKFLLPIVLVSLFLLGLSAYSFFRPHAPPTPSKPAVVTHSTDKPDETKPAKNYEWKGTLDDPKYINLPTITAGGFIQTVGVDQNKQVAVPSNIHMAGWFRDSVKPGQKGLSIIDGHLDGKDADGIFIHLQKMKQDDTFTIEFGDGSTKQFKVTSITTVDTKDAANVLFSQNPKATSQLNLITCGGTFDRSSRLYDKRVIVSSELVGLRQ
jgi:LPXTG-site transpeptidase (sortase) family protein